MITPDIIYLTDELDEGGEEITWCDERLNVNDTKYIKAPLTTQKDKAEVACNDGLVGQPVTAELEIWIRFKLATKQDENRKFDKGYKFALEDVLSKIRDIKEAN